jgi:ADP-heptose:LPS heptosyltransferase
MCTPALRALRTHFPKCHIAFLAERESSDLLVSNPYLDEVIVLERERYRNPLYWLKKIWQIRKKRFGLVIDFLSNPRSAYISFLSGAKRRIGYDLPGRRYLYSLLVRSQNKPQYSAQRKLEVLRELGVEGSDLKLDFFVPNEAGIFAESFFREEKVDRDHLVVSVSPTSRRHFRRWSLDRFAKLADWLIREFKATVVLVWGPGEKSVVDRMENVMKEKPVICWETEELSQLGAILRGCDLHIGNDNGTKHIAVAMGKPTITVYGPDNPASWTYPDLSRHRFLKRGVDCPDCDKIKHECRQPACLDRITAEDVQEVFLQLIKDLEKAEERGFVEKIARPATD